MRATFNESQGPDRTPYEWTIEVSTEARQVYVHTERNDDGPGQSAALPPTQARELAAALLRAADEAEGVSFKSIYSGPISTRSTATDSDVAETVRAFRETYPHLTATGRFVK
ncbi:hypothetical protein ACFRCI_23705 [Streptomyces sp. NPDC056638]|uniref:hypothetical protein n=1 Tax=Streptomyces sp. NPDC056638 TaxID=3345887 RepID=UPI0036982603